jgi:hypothetical protein
VSYVLYNHTAVCISIYETTDICTIEMLKTILAKTTIQVEEETREKLKNIGKKGESYDDIINRLLKLHKE